MYTRSKEGANKRLLNPGGVFYTRTSVTRPCREGTGARKRAYVTTFADGPHKRPALWRYFFHPMAFRQLPYEDSEFKYDTCAVVSNSGRLLKYENGEEIDKAQAVFRINYPPTEGYEKHVGSRTTFDIVNGHHAQRLGLVPAERLRFLDPKYCDQVRREESICSSRACEPPPAAALYLSPSVFQPLNSPLIKSDCSNHRANLSVTRKKLQLPL